MFRVTAAARSTLTDGAESITGARVSKELKGKIISPVSKASWNQFNNSIELLSKGEWEQDQQVVGMIASGRI